MPHHNRASKARGSALSSEYRLARREPAHRRMLPRPFDESGDERPGRLLVHGVVGQEPGRLGRVHRSRPARREVGRPPRRSLDRIQRTPAPRASPRRRRGSSSARNPAPAWAAGRGPNVDRPRNPTGGRAGIRAGSIRFQGGTSTGRVRPRASPRNVSRPPRQLRHDHSGRAAAPEFRFLLAVRRMVAMRPSVLQHLDARGLDPHREGAGRQGRDHREPHRHCVLARDAREPVEGRTRLRGVIVPPPHRGDPAFAAPRIEFIGKIGPVHWLVEPTGGDRVSGRRSHGRVVSAGGFRTAPPRYRIAAGTPSNHGPSGAGG